MKSTRILGNNSNINQLGFTIVELLVVIVIIGILAAITIVSYVGLSKKANEATLISDLSAAKKTAIALQCRIQLISNVYDWQLPDRPCQRHQLLH